MTESNATVPDMILRDTTNTSGSSDSASLSIKNVSKSFGRTTVLTGVTFDAPAGSITAVLGPSGQGKTTLLRLIAGFEKVDDGRILLNQQVIGSSDVHVRPDRRGIGIVPQDGALFPHLTVDGNIGFGLPRGSEARIDEMTRLVGLEGMGSRRPAELSGGQQQRVALARALAPSPHLVLLDEPFSALDAGLRAGVRDEVIAIIRRTGTTALLVTHDQDEAMSIADHVVVLLDGTVAQQGSPVDIYEHPSSVAVARFIGDANLLPGHVTSGSVSFELGSQAASGPDGDVTVLVRPEHLEISDDGEPGVVERRTYHGHDGIVTVRLMSDERVSVRVGVDELRAVGSAVRVRALGPITVLRD